MLPAEGHPGDQIGIAGDFGWRSPDGLEEAVLRLQPSGKWWHAAHSHGQPKSARRNLWHSAAHVEAQSRKHWEMAESLGSWHVEPAFCDDEEASQVLAVVLHCESCRWASGDPKVRGGANKLRPDLKRGSHDLASSVELGEVAFCYVVRWCPTTRRPSLVLQTELGCDEDHRIAVRGLGFARSYRHQRRGPEPSRDEARRRGSPAAPPAELSLAQRPPRGGPVVGAPGAAVAGTALGYNAAHAGGAAAHTAAAAGGAAAVVASYLVGGTPQGSGAGGVVAEPAAAGAEQARAAHSAVGETAAGEAAGANEDMYVPNGGLGDEECTEVGGRWAALYGDGGLSDFDGE
eukprot:CAMPEP_0197939794 /NCGR_PEP_ID=MMETSP1439-20131203/120233_1 /TAXON_ID=66791 /ORGANISM="Gonyaulax spinifera, Strain CCMP409" /LENGTH=345 /DNA_ID=CAMNT_0043562935 /DNA_START=1 /DNA_END=1035 /DNA_ORIENTATION=-